MFFGYYCQNFTCRWFWRQFKPFYDINSTDFMRSWNFTCNQFSLYLHTIVRWIRRRLLDFMLTLIKERCLNGDQHHNQLAISLCFCSHGFAVLGIWIFRSSDVDCLDNECSLVIASEAGAGKRKDWGKVSLESILFGKLSFQARVLSFHREARSFPRVLTGNYKSQCPGQ